MSNFYKPAASRAGGGRSVLATRASILSTLQATTMDDSGPTLPAEILATVINYLPVADQIRFARTSRRMKEMVYDDTRWISRLKNMGCWDEAEARQRFEDALKRKRESAALGANPNNRASVASSTTLFDASLEEERRRKLEAEKSAAMPASVDGFETLSLSGTQAKELTPSSFEDPTAILNIFKGIKSIRGFARQEYGKIYGALAPFYYDLVRAKSHSDPVAFKVFRDPERQAQMLCNLQMFKKSDWAQGWHEREEKLTNMVNIFETAVLREFEQGYEFWDVDGRMKRYAHVLHTLNGGTAAMDLFVSKHPLASDRDMVSKAIDCINQGDSESISLEPSRQFFKTLSTKLAEQMPIIARMFPEPDKVFWSLVHKIREEIIMDYLTPILDDTHERSTLAYLKAMAGLAEQCIAFSRSLTPPPGSETETEEHAQQIVLKCFEAHLDLYLQEELDYFTQHAEREVTNWEQKLSEQDATVESFYMKNFSRQADKNAFLSSFKKVVMMPVTVLGGSSSSGPNGKTSQTPSSNRNSTTGIPATSASPLSQNPGGTLDRAQSPLPSSAPDDELKAKAALMANRLEGIKSLFSIEVALDLVHTAKTSLGRASIFIQLGGQAGGEAREQCSAIFVVLLKILGQTHIKNGFAKALDHLSKYNPREVSDHGPNGVAPLVTFIELVNVGDLISQMIDVFYEQQLAAPKIADRNDFIDPAGLAKRKFEQLLDENVAAGLNKGIDVLMDEVEYLCAATQEPTDYNPGSQSSEEKGAATLSKDTGMGPTHTATRIVELVSSHTNMLVGSTEKTMLDVFNGEVGLRLFTAICKHLKRQRINTEGSIKLIADMTLYFDFVKTLKNQDLLAYFRALRELSQIYLIDARHAKDMAAIIADGDRFGGVFRAEEVYEFAERRADWYQVRRNVERAMYGLECCVM